jgi:hypothetical protein
MLPRLRARFDRLEGQRAALLESLTRLTPAQLQFRPGSDQWSSLDVVEHLVLVEERVLWAAPRRPEGRTPRERVRAAAILALMFARSLLGARIEAPTKAVMPQGGTALPALKQRWEGARGLLRQVLEETPADGLGRPLMRHPFTGWLSLRQSLGFFQGHIAHHARQLDRIQHAPGFPRNIV